MLGWIFLVWAALGARARCTILHCCFLGGCFFFGGGSGGANNVLGWPSYKIFSWTCCYAIHSSLALYLATRYQLLFLTCKTPLIFALLFLVFFGGDGWGGFWRGANNVLGWPSFKIFSWTCCYAIHSSLALYLQNCRHTKRKMAITKWAKVCNQWSSNGCGVKQFCRVLPKNWCHTLSIWWRNIMTFNSGFIHWNK